MFALLAYLGPHPSFSFAFLPHLFKEGDKNTLEQTLLLLYYHYYFYYYYIFLLLLFTIWAV